MAQVTIGPVSGRGSGQCLHRAMVSKRVNGVGGWGTNLPPSSPRGREHP